MKFKDDVIAARYDDMSILTKAVAEYMDIYAKEHYGVEIMLTATVSTKEEDLALGRESDTHRTRRAFDVRVRDLPESLIAELCSIARKKYGQYGASVKGVPALVVYKPHGTGKHLHIQLNRKYALPELTYKGNNNGEEKASN